MSSDEEEGRVVVEERDENVAVVDGSGEGGERVVGDARLDIVLHEPVARLK
jgi:hypothetical protein